MEALISHSPSLRSAARPRAIRGTSTTFVWTGRQEGLGLLWGGPPGPGGVHREMSSGNTRRLHLGQPDLPAADAAPGPLHSRLVDVRVDQSPQRRF